MTLRQARCRSCSAPIVWMKTINDKNIPVDPDGIDEADLEWRGDHPLFDQKEHVSHFATCPHAKSHRRPRE